MPKSENTVNVSVYMHKDDKDALQAYLDNLNASSDSYTSIPAFIRNLLEENVPEFENRLQDRGKYERD